MPQLYKPESKKFYHKDEPTSFLEVVHLEPHQITKIIEKVNKQIMLPGEDDTMEPRIEVDRGLDREETAVLAVKSWHGYRDADGNEMECNEENKRFWSYDPDFMRDLNKFRKILHKDVTEKRKAAVKN